MKSIYSTSMLIYILVSFSAQFALAQANPLTLAQADRINTPQVAPQIEKPVAKKKTRSLKSWFKESYVQLGTGVHYLSFKQRPPDNIAPINYGYFGYPTLLGTIRTKLSDQIGLRAEYMSEKTPDVKSDSMAFLNKKVSWNYLTLGLDYAMLKGFSFLGKSWNPIFLFFYQSHSMPFLTKIDANSYGIEQLKFKTASLGIYFDILASKSWSYFLTNRLQFGLSNSELIKVTNGYSFDGCLGAIYHFNKLVSLSLEWGGQLHNYKYTIGTTSGDYALVTSIVSTNLGFYF